MSDIFLFIWFISGICIFISFKNPFLFKRFFKEKTSKKYNTKFFGAIFLISFILTGLTTDGKNNNTNKNQENKQEKTEEKQKDEIKTEQLVEVKKIDEVVNQEIRKEEEKQNVEKNQEQNKDKKENKNLVEVVNVVDGDTIVVKIDGKDETLRLIGIDTPEVVDPRKPVQCFGKEASNRAKELLSGKKVYLEEDKSQGERDKYNRLLRYVILEDKTNFNEKMIKDGFAHEYTYNIPYKYQEEFKKAEKEARENKKGLWAEDTCNGKTNQTFETSQSKPKSTSKDEEKSEVKNTGKYACDCKKTCSKMSSCEEAQYQLKVCGCSKRDSDKDGVACNDICK